MNAVFEPLVIDSSFVQNPRYWLTRHMSTDLPWLLVHADDGVIWGKLDNKNQLHISSDFFPDQIAVSVELRALTIQEARIFGPDGEILIWRTENGFSGRLVNDKTIGLEFLQEKHLLWFKGNPLQVIPSVGFSLLQEGQQGQLHAPPVIPKGSTRPRLIVKHYINYDLQGQAFIETSRLAGLEA